MAETNVGTAHEFAAEPAAIAAVVPSHLLAAVKDCIGSEFARHAARYIGADEWRTQSAIDMLASAVLRRVARRSVTPEGAARVFAELGSPRIDSDVLATVDRLLADEPAGLGEGTGAEREAAQGLLGRRTRLRVFAVASTSGLTVDATWKLLALATPLVYAALRDHVRARGLDAEALRNRLESEYVEARSKRRYRPGSAVAAAPAQTLPFIRAARARSAAAVARLDHRALVRGGLAAAGLAIAVSLWLSSEPTTEAVVAGSGRATRLVEDANPSLPGARHSAGLEGLVAFLSSSDPKVEYAFVLHEVQFEPASATLRSASNAQLAQLARVLADFPDARLTIEAYAEDAPDVALGHTHSESRALAVRAAIAALGVQPSRMRHAGISGASGGGSRVEARVTKE
jgi:outer membrane protein OmpA-like peptidoglycan-associated protein